jgi:hypothetical protein
MYVYMHKHAYLHKYVYIDLYTYIHTYVYTYVHECMCTCTYVYVCTSRIFPIHNTHRACDKTKWQYFVDASIHIKKRKRLNDDIPQKFDGETMQGLNMQWGLHVSIHFMPAVHLVGVHMTACEAVGHFNACLCR